MPDNATVGACLKRLREIAGLQAQEVARALGLTKGGYSYWESGGKDLTLADARKLAEIFEMPFTTLLYELGMLDEQPAISLGQWLDLRTHTGSRNGGPIGGSGAPGSAFLGRRSTDTQGLYAPMLG
jgi:transcriptional regulator with XRE-family HTH domain